MAVEWKERRHEESSLCSDGERVLHYLNHNEELAGLRWRHGTLNTNQSDKGGGVSPEGKNYGLPHPFLAVICGIFSRLSKVWRGSPRIVVSSTKRLRVLESQAPVLRYIGRACSALGDDGKIRSRNLVRSFSLQGVEGSRLEHSFKPVG